MGYLEREPVLTDEMMYRDPVLRRGAVFSSPEKIDKNNALQVRAELVKIDFSLIWKRFLRDCKFSDVGKVIGSVTEVLREGPAVRWPDVEVWTENGLKWVISPSVTVCLPPRRPKAWVRLALVDVESLNTFYNKIELYNLFHEMNDSCNSCLRRVIDEFNKAISKVMDVDLDETINLRVKTVTTDLKDDGEKLRMRNFSLEEALAEQVDGGWMKELMETVVEVKLLKDANDKKVDKSNWIAMSMRDVSGLDLVGLYAFYQQDFETDFAGFAHYDSNQILEYSASRKLSGELQQHVASEI